MGSVLKNVLLGENDSVLLRGIWRKSAVFLVDQFVEFFDQHGELIVVFFLLNAEDEPIHTFAFFGGHIQILRRA